MRTCKENYPKINVYPETSLILPTSAFLHLFQHSYLIPGKSDHNTSAPAIVVLSPTKEVTKRFYYQFSPNVSTTLLELLTPDFGELVVQPTTACKIIFDLDRDALLAVYVSTFLQLGLCD